MNRLNTKAVIREISAKMGCYKKDALELMNHFCDIVAETLAAGGAVDFRPLGVFRLGKKGSIQFRPARRLSRKVKEARVNERAGG